MSYPDTRRRRNLKKLDTIIARLRETALAPWIRIFGSAANPAILLPGDIDAFVDMHEVTLRGDERTDALKNLLQIALDGGWSGNHGYFDPYVLTSKNILFTRSDTGSLAWIHADTPETTIAAGQTGILLTNFTRNFVAELAAAAIPEPVIPTDDENYPLVASANHVAGLVEEIHRRAEDFEEGDLQDRLYAFPLYRLTLIPIADIDLEEFETDEDLILSYAEKTGTMPPIVFDPSSGSIIDGIHRTNAADRRGQQTILGYVGTTSQQHAKHHQKVALA